MQHSWQTELWQRTIFCNNTFTMV